MKRRTRNTTGLFFILICFSSAFALAENEEKQIEGKPHLAVGRLIREAKIKEYVGKLGDLRLAFVKARVVKDHEAETIAAAQLADLELALLDFKREELNELKGSPSWSQLDEKEIERFKVKELNIMVRSDRLRNELEEKVKNGAAQESAPRGSNAK